MEEHRNTIVLCAFSLLKIFIHSQALANGTNCSELIVLWEPILSGWTNTGLSGKSLFTTCAEILGWSEVTRVWIEVRSFLQEDLNPRQKEKFCVLDGKHRAERARCTWTPRRKGQLQGASLGHSLTTARRHTGFYFGAQPWPPLDKGEHFILLSSSYFILWRCWNKIASQYICCLTKCCLQTKKVSKKNSYFWQNFVALQMVVF